MILKVAKEKKGITLIALVITIIVLLILAGVSIATLTGDNGLLSKTQQAKEENEMAADRDLIAIAVSESQIGENGYQELNSNNLQEAINSQFNGRNVVVSDNEDGTFTISCLDTLKDYKVTSNAIEDGIDWNEAMANAVAPESQDDERNEGVIGIGTDGNPIDMDLWEYEWDDGTEGYGLNDKTSLESDASADASTGYLGTDFNNIIMPQYISKDNGKTWNMVTNLDWTFYNCTELIKINKLPSTAKSLKFTFRNCKELLETPELPNSIEILRGTFYSCENLKIFDKNIPINVSDMLDTFYGCKNMTKFEAMLPSSVTNLQSTFSSTGLIEFYSPIPNTVVNMQSTFKGCTNLSNFDTEIPSSVINMQETFCRCTSLKKINIKIPKSVVNFYNTFRECTNLSGIIEIEADLKGNIMNNGRRDYEYCFLYSSIQGEGLDIICSEKIYNLFYDGLTSNKLNSYVCEEDSNIKMYKL